MIKSAPIFALPLAALIVVGAMASFGPLPAAAQTAENLDCKGCVRSRQIRNNGIKSKDIRDGHVRNADIADDAVDVTKLAPGVRDAIAKDQTFLQAFNSDAEVALVTAGPLSLVARCLVDDDGLDSIEVFLTSTVDNWLRSGELAQRNGGDESPLGFASVLTGTAGQASNLSVAPGAVAPDGSAIGPIVNIAMWAHALGHICVVQGSTTTTTGTL